jgi:NADH:ubiquinone oxidoreductase subunit C
MINIKQLNKKPFYLINYLTKILIYNFAKKIELRQKDDIITIYCTNKNLDFLLIFLKNHYVLKYKTLVSITAVDYPKKVNRFEVNYFLLSYKLNTRLIIKVETNDTIPLPSITNIYSSAAWFEREV